MSMVGMVAVGRVAVGRAADCLATAHAACRRVIAIAMLAVGACMASTAAAQSGAELAASAEAAVDTYVSKLLATMSEIRPLYESDRPAYFAAVDEALAEFVDFREVARGVMAKYSTGPDGASDEQLDRFAEVFRSSLLDFYGSALASYGGVDYAFVSTGMEDRNTANTTNVRMNMTAEDGGRFEIQYTMFLDEQGVWKLKNLYVEGVNLRRQYHAQFDSLMMSNDYDIDRVIDAWQVGG